MEHQSTNYNAMIDQGRVVKEVSIDSLIPHGVRDGRRTNNYAPAAIMYKDLVTQLAKDVLVYSGAEGLGATLTVDNNSGANSIQMAPNGAESQKVYFKDTSNWIGEYYNGAMVNSDFQVFLRREDTVGGQHTNLSVQDGLMNLQKDGSGNGSFQVQLANDRLMFDNGTTGANSYLDYSASTTNRTWSLPNASGTVALTSDIPAVSGVYLPLAGGTMDANSKITFESGFSWIQHQVDASNYLRLSMFTSGTAGAFTLLRSGLTTASFTVADGVDFQTNDGNLGFYGATPVAQPAAITQTYATVSSTHAARTASVLTDSTGGTADATVVAISGSGADSDINNNFADLIAQLNNIKADSENTAQVLNDFIDKVQTLGLVG